VMVRPRDSPTVLRRSGVSLRSERSCRGSRRRAHVFARQVESFERRLSMGETDELKLPVRPESRGDRSGAPGHPRRDICNIYLLLRSGISRQAERGAFTRRRPKASGSYSRSEEKYFEFLNSYGALRCNP